MLRDGVKLTHTMEPEGLKKDFDVDRLLEVNSSGKHIASTLNVNTELM